MNLKKRNRRSYHHFHSVNAERWRHHNKLLNMLLRLQKVVIANIQRKFGQEYGDYEPIDKTSHQRLRTFKETVSGCNSFRHVKNLIYTEKIQKVNYLRQRIINYGVKITPDKLAMKEEESITLLMCPKMNIFLWPYSSNGAHIKNS